MRYSSRRLAAALLLLLLLPAVGAGQAATDSALTRAIRGMASDLRNLVTAQEAHFAERNRYASDLATLGAKFRTSTGNSVELVNADSLHWGAVMRAAGFTGSCTIAINLPEPQFPRTAVEKKAFPEGEPACDGDGELEGKRWASAAAFTAAQRLATIAKLQEQHFGRAGGYATDLSQLQGLRPDSRVEVTIEVTPSTSRLQGYFLVAKHTRYPASSCVLSSGWGPWGRRVMTAGQGRRPSGELQAICDDFAP